MGSPILSLGDTAKEENFRRLYNAILINWFSSSDGYLIDHETSVAVDMGGKHKYIVVRPVETHRNSLLVVELNGPERWNDEGKKEVLEELTLYAEGRFHVTQ